MSASPFDVLAELLRAVTEHGLAAIRSEAHIDVENGRLLLAGEVFVHSEQPGQVTVTVEVIAATPQFEGRPIVETFAGWGPDARQAATQAFLKFLTTSFHVLIESFTSHACEGQVERERWARVDAAWTVFSGPVTSQSGGPSTIGAAFPAFYEQLTQLFSRTLAPCPHAVSVYLGAFHGELKAVEVRLDSEPWPEAESLVRAQPWPLTDYYQSQRHFLVALPVEP